jgi:hypothetical protein
LSGTIAGLYDRRCVKKRGRDARAHGIEPEKFLTMIEGERSKGYARDKAYERVLRRLRRRRPRS